MARRGLIVGAASALALAGSAPPVPAAPSTPRAYPFAPPSKLRAPRRSDALPRLWSDGRPCSVGCRAAARPGWPIKPFDREHILLGGFDELRPANFHTGVDIRAPYGTPVYAVQGGAAEVIAAGTTDARVRVGRFEYWHLNVAVASGARVVAYSTVLGTTNRSSGHLHFAEVLGGRYLNPLRPGGRILAPWRDRARPVLARPEFGRAGYVRIRGFDPQTRRERGVGTPVIGLAGVAYRLFDRRGRRIGPLRWALRGSQNLDPRLRRRVYPPGTRRALAQCAVRVRTPCRPNWAYRLAGGLAPRLALRRGRIYRLSAYAWDWAGNVSALDTRLVAVAGEVFVRP